MADKVITDRDYLFLSAMLKARESSILTRERMDRMLSAPTYSEAAKLLTDCGYEDLSKADAKGIDLALSQHRQAVFAEVRRFVPQSELVDIFRLKYDYHNAKVLIKSEGAGVSGGHLLSESGRTEVKAMTDAYHEDDYRFVPMALGKAMQEAESVLNRTGNPQLADFALDRAYFAEMSDMARNLDSRFLKEYVQLQIDVANLRSAVRTVRMGRDQDFLMTALIPGGSADPARVAQTVATGGEGLIAVFNSAYLKPCAALGAEAVKGGSMTSFELSCDNAVTAFLGTAKLKCFGVEPVVEYLALVEAEITAIRMILTGRLAGIEPDVIRERLRDINA